MTPSDPYGSDRSLGTRLRRRRFRHVLRLIDAILAERGECRILDLGGTGRYWRLMAPMIGPRPIMVTCVNLDIQPPDDAPPAPFLIQDHQGDACRLDPAHFSADLVHSNSVIEHIPDPVDQQNFALACRQLAPSYFIQTPDFWFPHELHFRTPLFHWLPEDWRVRLLQTRSCGYFPRTPDRAAALAQIRSIALLTAPHLRALFPDGRLIREWFGPLPKSLMMARYHDPDQTRQLFRP